MIRTYMYEYEPNSDEPEYQIWKEQILDRIIDRFLDGNLDNREPSSNNLSAMDMVLN